LRQQLCRKKKKWRGVNCCEAVFLDKRAANGRGQARGGRVHCPHTVVVRKKRGVLPGGGNCVVKKGKTVKKGEGDG